jgi:tetratricopeptide (TPR) repeat protein
MLLPTLVFAALLQAPASNVPAPHHQPNFESEREEADKLFLAKKELEALPLYEDLCRQDPTIGLFAERHAAGLLAKEASLPNTNLTEAKARLQVHLQAINELNRAVKLGDNSVYVRTALDVDSKNLTSAVVSGIPITVGYSYQGKPEAQATFQEGNAAFSRAEFANAADFFRQAATIDPAWYQAALYAGDSYFRAKDWNNAGLWFGKAIAIDPDRETAYRYWGDMLYQTGSPLTARQEYVLAVVAEPYGNEAFHRLAEWAAHTHHQLVHPAITRPEFITPNRVLQIDPALLASTQDGRSSWIVYQQYRVAHGARTLNQTIIAGGFDRNAVATPKGYLHTIDEEHAALRAMLADIDDKIKSGTLTESALDPSIANIGKLEAANALGAWIALNAADAGIHADYPDYRAHHRKHLFEYINTFLIRDTPQQQP